MAFPHLFQPLVIGPKTARNRVEVAPAAPFLAGHDGSNTPELYEYERQLAASGAGIVNLGVTDVDPHAVFSSRILNAGTDENQPDFNDLAEMFHSYDVLAGVELIYLKYMLAPPDEVVNGTSLEEVRSIISAYADAARRVSVAGFDIAFIHGGHGNVPAMFFSKKHNRRTDCYGGSFENRCRFAIDLLKAVREAAGLRVAIEYRISAEEMLPGHTTLEETLEFARAIEPYIDLLHVSRGMLEVDDLLHYVHPALYLERAINLPYAERFKQALSVPVTCVGSFNLELAEQAVAEGKVDMVSMARTFLADPRCLKKARRDRLDDIRPCIRCNTCIDRTHTFHQAIRCAVNPLLTRETRFDIDRSTGLPLRAARSRRAAVIGGGPAGMQAAVTLAQRGHRVVLFERSDALGGLLNLAGKSASKADVRAYRDWLVRQIEQSDAEVRLNTEATPELLAADEEGFDAVFVAVGSRPIIPRFAHDSELPAVWVGDLDEEGPLPERILVVGAGLTGLECALSLARAGKRVMVVDALDAPAKGGTAINIRCLFELLDELGVSIMRNAPVTGACAQGALVRNADGEETVLPCDMIVYSLGFRVDEAVIQLFKDAFDDCWCIGDCMQGTCNVFNATQSAYDRAMHL